MSPAPQPVPVDDWTAPGCFPVAPGVRRIPLPMPQDGLRAVNVYLVEGPDGVALIDAGWRVPGNLDLLADQLRSAGVVLDDVRDVFVTHVHRDHYTLGPELRRATGARVHLGAAERPGVELIQQQGDSQPVSSMRELRRAGASELADAVVGMVADEPWEARDWESPDTWLAPGPVVVAGRAMEAVAVPGHTKGHLVFHDLEAGVLFTGDHVLPTISPSIGFELGDWDLPLGRYLESLALLLGRPDAVMLPAHGHPGGSVHARVRELLGHHDVRLAATLAGVRAGARTGLAVAEGLPWTRRDRRFDTLDPFNRMIAVCETMAHLDLLLERGPSPRRTTPGWPASPDSWIAAFPGRACVPSACMSGPIHRPGESSMSGPSARGPVLVTVLLALALGGCGSRMSPDEIEELIRTPTSPLYEIFRSQSDEAIECIAEAIHDSDMSNETLEGVLTADPDVQPSDDEQDAMVRLVAEVDICTDGR